MKNYEAMVKSLREGSKFEIIVNSQGPKYDIEDKTYYGQKPNLCCGWQFEFENEKGEINYNSVTWYEGTPEEYCESWLQYGDDALFTGEHWNGWQPTGRVVFRGYAESYYDSEERDWFVKEVEVKPTPTKKTWTEDEIKNLIQVNDKVLYGALKKLYACQTTEEQNDKETHEQNGKGFNGVDAPILSSFCEFLNKTGFLTPKQKVLARKKLVKYNKQLTALANA